MSANPYEAPKARVAEPLALRTDIPIAGNGARFLNYFFDWLFTTLLGGIVGGVLGYAGYEERLTRMNWFEQQFLGYLIYAAYYFALELSFGWTLGKLITGTRVVDARGARPSSGKLLGRSFARVVPFEPLSFLGSTGIGWHDRWSGTRVISLRRKEGPTLAESFNPAFRGAKARPATQAFVPTDGPPAWCPNCSLQIAATTEKCAGCGADFTSPDGWKPLESRP
jgi:uncharacterized RDD family membrane protein YckC